MEDREIDTRVIGPILHILLLATALLTTACGGGGSSGGPDCRFNEAWISGQCSIGDIAVTPITLPGGIWRGVDSVGRDVVAFVTVFGDFQFVDGSENQGSGKLVVGDGDTVTSNFQLVTQLGDTFADGTTVADCTFSGTIIERQSLAMTENCTTAAGLQIQEMLSLNFDTLYNRDASLEIIAGMYETQVGSILNITSDGVIFVQDAVSGCVANGQASITLSNANTYFYEYRIDNCIGPNAIWNGSGFSGLAVLDNTASSELLTIAVIGEVGGVAISLVVENVRL